MKNVTEILSAIGVEIPAEKQKEFDTEFKANYKTINEFNQKVEKLESEKNGLKDQLNTATETLKGFEGVDVEDLKNKVAEAQKKLTDAENEYKKKLETKEFEEVLAKEMETFKFSSKSAKESVMNQIIKADLKCVDGKILGLNDLVESIKAKDAEAFVDEGNPPAKFTSKMNPSGKEYKTKEEIMAIKDSGERQEAIKNNIDLFV